MQRLVGGLFVLLLTVFLPFGPACAQVEDMILIGGNYRLQGNLHNMQDGFFGAPSPADDDPTQRFVDTRLRLSFDLRPASPLSVHYGLEIGDMTFGARKPAHLGCHGAPAGERRNPAAGAARAPTG